MRQCEQRCLTVNAGCRHIPSCRLQSSFGSDREVLGTGNATAALTRVGRIERNTRLRWKNLGFSPSKTAEVRIRLGIAFTHRDFPSRRTQPPRVANHPTSVRNLLAWVGFAGEHEVSERWLAQRANGFRKTLTVRRSLTEMLAYKGVKPRDTLTSNYSQTNPSQTQL